MIEEKYLIESKLNKSIAKDLKDIGLKIQGMQRKVKNKEFPYDESENLKEILKLEFTGLRMKFDEILRSIK